MKIIFKTKQKHSEMETIPNQKPKCLISHPLTLEYPWGQEVGAHPGRERGQSRLSHLTLSNLSLKVFQVILETGSLRFPEAFKRAVFFSWWSQLALFPKRETNHLEVVSLWVGVGCTPTQARFYRHTVPSRSGFAAQEGYLLSFLASGYPKLFNTRGTIVIYPLFTFPVLGNSWGKLGKLLLLNAHCPQQVPLLV